MSPRSWDSNYYTCHYCGATFNRASEWDMSLVDSHLDSHKDRVRE
jgi:hypothetical protein